MTEFVFDRSKSYEENYTSFLEFTKGIDADMAQILIAHSDKLTPIVHNGKRDTKARTTFNEAVAEALDQRLTPNVDEGCE